MKPLLLFCLIWPLAGAAAAAVGGRSPALLTPAQREWLAGHPEIVLGVGEEWAPWVIARADGQIAGFAADHLALLGDKLGIPLRLEAGPWPAMVEQAQTGRLAGLTLSAPLAEREGHFLFTDVFHRVQYFIYQRTGDRFRLQGAGDLAGRRVGYPEGVATIEKLLAAHPGIEAVPQESPEALADALLQGGVDAAVASYALEHWRASEGVLGFAVPSDQDG